MAPRSERPPVGRRTTNTRRVMIGAFVGAVLTITVTSVLSWDRITAGGTAQRAQAAQASARAKAFAAPPGSCLQWTKADRSDIHQVACTEEHLFEMVGVADVSGVFGKDAPFPPPEQRQQLQQERCTPVANQYLSGKLDPHGRFKVSSLTSEQEWRNGDRTMRCGLQVPTASGALYPVFGPVAKLDQSDVYDTGICLGINGRNIGDPVTCDRPHSYEIIGTVDLGAQFPKEFPDFRRQDEALANACAAMAGQYAPGQDMKKKGLEIAWDNRSQESWNVGSRKVNCKVGAPLPDSSGLAPVTGSARGEVVVGKEPAPTVTATVPPGAPATTVQPPAEAPHPSERPPAHADQQSPSSAPSQPSPTTQQGG
ncbi:septum formation family protein [Streptoalloteichus tenebrarius]|nr:septum formation family protein [Streptoalloteichus tenebrarius]